MAQSVELLLDPASDAAVRAEWAALAEHGLPSEQRPRPDRTHRPHVTLYAGVGIAPDAEDLLLTALDGLDLRIVLGSRLVFGPRRGRSVLVRSVLPTRELLERQAEVAAICGAEPDGQFGPGAWSPHVTLARRVPTAELGRAVEAVPDRTIVARVTAARRWDGAVRVAWPLGRAPAAEVELVARSYALITDFVGDRSPAELAEPSALPAWTVGELLFHQLLDAERVLVALASPTPAPPNCDAVRYWAPEEPDAGAPGPGAHDRYVRAAAAAYQTPLGLVRHWGDTAGAAVRAAGAAPAGARISTQGRVLTVADFLSTVAVEATVHYLDFTAEVPARGQDGELLGHVRSVLDGLLGTSLPGSWSDLEAVLKGSGRTPLSVADRGVLGKFADRFPLLS